MGVSSYLMVELRGRSNGSQGFIQDCFLGGGNVDACKGCSMFVHPLDFGKILDMWKKKCQIRQL